MGDSRKKIAKQDDVYIKDASRTLRLITARRCRRKVMSEPPTMPPAPRFGISPKPISGQLRVGRPQIHNLGRLFACFLDSKPPIHAGPIFGQ